MPRSIPYGSKKHNKKPSVPKKQSSVKNPQQSDTIQEELMKTDIMLPHAIILPKRETEKIDINIPKAGILGISTASENSNLAKKELE